MALKKVIRHAAEYGYDAVSWTPGIAQSTNPSKHIKEIEYIKSYIDLQKLRFGNYITVNINVDGDMDLYAIEPMLLIPFVENAFKHGTGMIENPVININIAVDAATHLLHFEIDYYTLLNFQ